MLKIIKIITFSGVAGFLIGLAGHLYLETGSTTHSALGGPVSRMDFIKAVKYNAPFTSRQTIKCGEAGDCPSQIVDKQHFIYNWIIWSFVSGILTALLIKIRS